MRIIENLIMILPMINTFSEFEAIIMKESGLKDDNLLIPLRMLLTGAPIRA